VTAVPLDRPLEPPPTDLSPTSVAEALRRAGIRACCLDVTQTDPASAAPPPSTVAGALAGVVERNPGYRWEPGPDDLLDIFPVPSVLDDDVPALHVAGKGLWRVLEEDVGLADHGVELFLELRDGDGPPVPADLPAGTLRFVLDELVAPLRATVWHISGKPGAAFLSVTLIA
jgi:hypothetical protein